MINRTRVEDFDTWKRVFDSHENLRRRFGFLGHHVNVERDDPHRIDVYLAASDLQRARDFAASDELREAMDKAGVVGPPEVTWMTPVREGLDWDRQLPAFILTHHVADFDEWLVHYDRADDMRTQRGIVGQAANRSLDDPSTAIVYHQAESFDTLERFLEDEALQRVMRDAGVTSEPHVTFVTGGWTSRY